ncbi:MAG: RNA polymerase sigma-70 factor [Bacteroidales bacterium]|nr:RNA polymerase sigma-70 factor [Bacteroidales bacterium]
MSNSQTKNIDIKYEEMFRTFFTSLCYFAQKYIPDPDTGKEIVHSVFVNIWEKRNEFDFDKPPKSYLFTAVYNRCMNYIRDQKKFLSGDVDEELRIFPESTEYSDHLEAAELEARIWKVINSLPEKCREVFILNRFEGKKYAEIADTLSISVKTVETQMSKALKTLREHLVDYIHLLILIMLKNLW